MDTYFGMDADEVERIGRELRSQAHHVGQIRFAVERLVSRAQGQWRGPDAERFVEEWAERRPGLQHLEQNMHELGQRAIANADEQRRISG